MLYASEFSVQASVVIVEMKIEIIKQSMHDVNALSD